MPRTHTPNSPSRPAAGDAVIASHDNRWLKRFRAALAGERETEGAVGVEGARLVEAALTSGLAIDAILISESGKRHLPQFQTLLDGVRLLYTTDRLFAGVADTQSPQGVAALLHPRRATVEDLARGAALIVVLIAIQDPGNVGTLVRAAEAFGATGAATCPAGKLGTANPLAPKALRASAGSALRLPVLHGVSFTILFSQLRVLGIKIYAAVPDAHPSAEGEHLGKRILRPWQADWKSPAAIVIGNEGTGLPEDVLRTADALVSIPQSPGAAHAGFESLNAAMSGTILLYEAMCQRRNLSAYND